MAAYSCGAEEAARILRYRCFQEAMEELHGAALLTAHHGGDQAETMLMHFMRGAGPGGLSGIAKSRPFAGGLLLRPLLSFSHADLCGALLEEGIAWREDETNVQPDGLRNQIRLSVMPLMEKLAPGCTRAMSRAAMLSAAEEEWWQQEAEAYLRDHGRLEKEFCFILRQPLEKQNRAYIRRILRAFHGAAAKKMGILTDRGMVSLDSEKTEEFVECLLGIGDEIMNLPGDMRGERCGTRLYLLSFKEEHARKESPLSLIGSTPFANAVMHAAPWKPGMPIGDGMRSQALDKSALKGAVVRYKQAGDVFPLLNGHGRQKLKDTLSAHQVDKPLRNLLPIVATGKTVLWVPGIGASGAAAIRPETQEGVWLSYEGLFPWEITSDKQDK